MKERGREGEKERKREREKERGREGEREGREVVVVAGKMQIYKGVSIFRVKILCYTIILY